MVERVRAAAVGLFALVGSRWLRAYPKAIRSFAIRFIPAKGRPRLVVWDQLHIVQVVKQRVGKRLLSIRRRVAYGCLGAGGRPDAGQPSAAGGINTAYIERLNATLRTWMPYLVRRTRTPSGSRERVEAAAVLDRLCVQFLLCMQPWRERPRWRLM